MASAIFARIDTIQGESKDARHRDEIEVISWSWGLSQSGGTGSGGGGAGKVSFRDLLFTHHVDKASPSLMKACATGKHLKAATITVRKGGGKSQAEYLVITLSDVLVASVSTSVSAEGDVTVEDVALSFAKVDLEYKPQKPDGSLDTGVHFVYDLKKNKAG